MIRGRKARSFGAVLAVIAGSSGAFPAHSEPQASGGLPSGSPAANGSVPPAAPSAGPPTAPVSPARAAGSAARAAVAELSAWAKTAKAALGAIVVDVETGGVLAASGEHEPRNAASNAKVVTAAAVLDKLGLDFRFTTGLFGKLADGAVSPLVLRGDGDPSLEADELWELASALREQGVKRVDGILVDQSRFDDVFVPPAFEQQPNEWAPFRAPVSAVAIERNTVTLNVAPRAPGAAAAAWFEPPGFVEIRGAVETRPGAAADGVRLTLSPAGRRLRADVAGFIGAGSPRLRVAKRVDDPMAFPGYVLAEILRRMGVDVRGDVSVGGRDVRARLSYIESEPLAVLVRELGKNSDNFYAEMLLKALGAQVRGTPGKSRDGADAALAWLTQIGAQDPGTRIQNGSGLFDANRLSAWTLAMVLRHAYLSPRIGPDFLAELAVGGVDGTLRARFRSLAEKRVVRAKTGTLDQVVALSGYVLAPGGRPPVAFAFIIEGTVRRADARQRIDAAVESIARSMWRG